MELVPKIILEGYQLGIVTDLLPVEPSVKHLLTTGGIISGPPVDCDWFPTQSAFFVGAFLK